LWIIKDCLAAGNTRFARKVKVAIQPTNADINFTKIARLQIATLRRWRVLDVRAGH
jgi:hypothetical protein